MSKEKLNNWYISALIIFGFGLKFLLIVTFIWLNII